MLKKLRITKITIITLIMAALSASPFGASVCVRADGLAADTLTITVGYFGGPYYEKRVFTADELWSLGVQYVDYTFIDNMPSVVIDHAAGVALADLMYAAGIDLGSVQSFNFWTNDKAGGYYNSFTKSFLIDTTRYCYYSLPDNYDYDYGEANELATSDGTPVPTMIALADNWQRVIAGASFGSDYLNLDTSTRFRLVYGQTDAVTHTASDSAKWIHRIEVTLGGAPTLTMDTLDLTLEVGSKFKSEARVLAADPIIAQHLKIEWSSSDESVATVDQNGEITVHSDGTATITAQFGDQSVSILVNGTPGETIDNGGKGTNYNQGQGGGTVDSGQLTVDSEGQGLTVTDPEPPLVKPGAVLVGREISILGAPAAASNGDEGGVQNWRNQELSDTAVELPIIETKIAPTYAYIAFGLFILGGIWEYVRFKRSRHA